MCVCVCMFGCTSVITFMCLSCPAHFDFFSSLHSRDKITGSILSDSAASVSKKKKKKKLCV